MLKKRLRELFYANLTVCITVLNKKKSLCTEQGTRKIKTRKLCSFQWNNKYSPCWGVNTMTFMLFPSLDHVLHVQFVVIKETQMNQSEKGAPDTFVFTRLKSNKNSHQHIMFWPCIQLCTFFPHMDNVWPGRKLLHFQLEE